MRSIVVLGLLAAALTPAAAAASGTGGASAPLPNAAPDVASGGAPYRDLPEPKRVAKPKPRVQPKRPARRGAAPAPRRQPPAPRSPSATGHRFPIAGPFSWGGSGGRFGAGRPGRTHQGQDLVAAEGTPIVAPASGVIEAVQYQASGAGHYIVLDGADEDRDYVFMHLRAGSITVKRGQQVRAGQRIGEVGNTGASFGAHLHFEVWTGKGWYTGGSPIDPLPLLRAWAR
jgi:murein DD-endopeptidase MepM/ murein hydrolase activator NlpD